MKEVKKTGQSNKNNTPKKNNDYNKKQNDSVKKQNTNPEVSEAPRVTKIESPVKEAKVVIDEDFVENDNDQKLIVVIAIALLVILVTVMCLLVGCERQEEEEPEKPQDDEIVVPVQVEDEDEKEDEQIVVKVTKTKTTKNEDEEEDEKEEVMVEIPTYDITYYYEDATRNHHESVKEGTKANGYVPQGYSACKYYKDELYSEDYSFTDVYENTDIYLNCEKIEYNVVYRFDEQIASNSELNPTTFTVENTITLEDLTTELIFVGWYLDSEYTKEVNELGRNIISYADSENTIYVYAKIIEEVNVELFDSSNISIYNKTFTKQEAESYKLPSSSEINACSTEGQKFLGWTSVKDSKNVEYKDASSLELNKDYALYAVCGDATIVYTSNGETVTVGYTNEELLEEGFDLPKPSDIGMETPVYFIPVDEETLTSKKVVSDDEIELGENEIYFSQVKDNTRPDYTPNIGDNVESFEKEFVGWIEKTQTSTDEQTTIDETTTTEENQTDENIIDETTTTQTESTEEIDLVTKEEVVDQITNSTEDEVQVELEAVWEIPEEENTEENTPVEVTPEIGVEELPTA